MDSREATNQDARRKAEHDTVDAAQFKSARSGTAGLPPGTRCNAAPLSAPPHALVAHLPGRSPAVPSA